MKFKIILILLLISISCLTQAQSKKYGQLNGNILDIDTRKPLPGANIIITGTMLGTISDLQGHFQLSKIPVGIYTIKATMMGYENGIQKVDIQTNEVTMVEFILKETVIETPALVVTAGKKAQSFQDVPNSVSVVMSEEIARKNRTYLDEILEYTPGVNVMRGDVNIRGSSGFSLGAGSRVLLLVDGIPMMPGDSGDIKWDIIPLSQIDRVEVVKGAGSAMYGSHALGGVINIISKEPSSIPFTEVKVSSGFYDNPYYSDWKWTDDLRYFNQIDLTHSRKWKNIGILLSGGRRESTGYQQNGDYLKWNFLGRIDAKFNSQSQLTLQSNYTFGDAGEIFQWRNQNDVLEMPITSVGDKTNSYKFSFNAVYRQLINQNFTYKIRTSYFKNYWKHDYHDNNDYSGAQKLGFEAQGDYLLNDAQSFTFGVEGIYDITRSAMFGNHDGSTLAAFFQDEIHLGDYFTATLGLRFDYHQVDTGIEDSQLNPKVGLTYKPSNLTTIRSSVGRGFRSPTMAEMFTETNTSGFEVIPNPSLIAEKAWSYEIGINHILNEYILFDVAAFHNDYWNFIEPEPDAQNTVQFINVSRARIRGMEFSVQSSFWRKRIYTTISYTLLEPKDISTGETLAYRSKHLFSYSIGFNYGNFETGIDYRYVSRLDNVKVYPDEDRVAQKVVDSRISYFYNRFVFALNVNNLLNYNYVQVERNLEPVRHYVFSVTANL